MSKWNYPKSAKTNNKKATPEDRAAARAARKAHRKQMKAAQHKERFK